MKVKIYNETDFDIKDVSQILKKIFSFELNNKYMNIVFITSFKMKQMNFYYRQKDYATDVLSFVEDIDSDFLGDIFINFQKARQQSLYYNHSIHREISFLATHGYLHLKGYVHNNENELQKMIYIQDKMLKKVNLDIDSIKKYL